MSEKRVTVTKSFLEDVRTMVNAINETKLNEASHRILSRIKRELEEKDEAAKRRRLYHTAKNAQSAEDREIAREMYFESRGIHKDFRDPEAFGKWE
jgi:hypothetical protein